MIDPKYLKEYKKAEAFKKVLIKLIVPLLVLEAAAGCVGIVVTAYNGFLLGLVLILFFVIPFTTVAVFIILVRSTGDKKMELEKALFESKMLAEDILKFGQENGIDLFLVALRARCFHELGLLYVPEWCQRNGELPTKKD